MRGTIVINNQAGRALRKQCVAVLAAHVVDCTGRFRTGDRVYVSFRGKDGGQYVVATGIVRCDEAVLRRVIGQSPDARSNLVESADPVEHDPVVVMQEQDLELLWPPNNGID